MFICVQIYIMIQQIYIQVRVAFASNAAGIATTCHKQISWYAKHMQNTCGMTHLHISHVSHVFIQIVGYRWVQWTSAHSLRGTGGSFCHGCWCACNDPNDRWRSWALADKIGRWNCWDSVWHQKKVIFSLQYYSYWFMTYDWTKAMHATNILGQIFCKTKIPAYPRS